MIWYNSRVVTEITFSTKIFRANSLRREGHKQPQEKKKKKKKKKSARHRVEPSATIELKTTDIIYSSNNTTYFQGLVPSNCACLKVLLLSSISRSALLSKFARSKFCSMKLSLTPSSLLWLVTMSLFFLQRQLFIWSLSQELKVYFLPRYKQWSAW